MNITVRERRCPRAVDSRNQNVSSSLFAAEGADVAVCAERTGPGVCARGADDDAGAADAKTPAVDAAIVTLALLVAIVVVVVVADASVDAVVMGALVVAGVGARLRSPSHDTRPSTASAPIATGHGLRFDRGSGVRIADEEPRIVPLAETVRARSNVLPPVASSVLAASEMRRAGPLADGSGVYPSSPTSARSASAISFADWKRPSGLRDVAFANHASNAGGMGASVEGTGIGSEQMSTKRSPTLRRLERQATADALERDDRRATRDHFANRRLGRALARGSCNTASREARRPPC